jgi:hypothetical protein
MYDHMIRKNLIGKKKCNNGYLFLTRKEMEDPKSQMDITCMQQFIDVNYLRRYGGSIHTLILLFGSVNKLHYLLMTYSTMQEVVIVKANSCTCMLFNFPSWFRDVAMKQKWSHTFFRLDLFFIFYPSELMIRSCNLLLPIIRPSYTFFIAPPWTKGVALWLMPI